MILMFKWNVSSGQYEPRWLVLRVNPYCIFGLASYEGPSFIWRALNIGHGCLGDFIWRITIRQNKIVMLWLIRVGDESHLIWNWVLFNNVDPRWLYHVIPKTLTDPPPLLRVMNDEFRNALTHLLPTVSSLPPLLTSTASAIRDKSRRAIPLRPDEEPARVWFASWLAAER